MTQDDYESMPPRERRERTMRVHRIFQAIKAIDIDRSTFRCVQCGEWFRMNFRSKSNPNVCEQCEP